MSLFLLRLTCEIEDEMISIENAAKQKQLRLQNTGSASLLNAITRTSSANKAYIVITDMTMENNVLDENFRTFF